MKLSVISPVYKAEEIVDTLVSRIENSVSKITDDFEIILVEDSSPDNSWEKIKENCKKSKKVKGIKLSKNFGQHYAITAGLEASSGDYVVVLDCDLQDNPDYIPEMYRKTKEGYDIVYAKMKNRAHTYLRNLYSKIFSMVFNLLAEKNYYLVSSSTYTLLSRKVVDSFCKINDAQRQYLLILQWLGFKSTVIEIVHEKRFDGKSSYSFAKLIEVALDGIISQSTKLLRVSIALGFMLSIISFVVLLYIVISYFFFEFKLGWTSIFSLILLSTGILLMSNGILGIYLGKTFEQAKGRPLYLIDERENI